MRIENTANRGVCLEVVTTMGTAVHHPGMSGDRLDVAKSNKWKGATGASSAHYLYEGGALPHHHHMQGGATTTLFPRAVTA